MIHLSSVAAVGGYNSRHDAFFSQGCECTHRFWWMRLHPQIERLILKIQRSFEGELASVDSLKSLITKSTSLSDTKVVKLICLCYVCGRASVPDYADARLSGA